MRIMRGGAAAWPSASMRASALRMELSSVSWVMRMKGAVAASDCGARWTMLSMEIFIVGQPTRNARHGTGPVVELKGHVVPAFMGLELGLPVGSQTSGRHPEGGNPVTAGNIADVGEDAGGGRMRARPPPLEHDVADKIALNGDRVVNAIDIGNGGALAHQRRMHALLDAIVGFHGDAQELDPIAEVVGVGDVGARDVLDAFDIDRFNVRHRAEGQRCQDRQLVRGVETADIEGRIGLRVAQLLRFLQHVGELAALAGHLGENVIAGAVEDAEYALDAVAGEALAQGLDDGNAAGDRGLETERGAVALGQPRKPAAVMGNAAPCWP